MRRLAANLLLAAASTFLALAMVELFLRWDDRHPPPVEQQVTLGGTAYSFHEALPVRSWGEAIAFIGDSFTRGTACAADETYPARFGKRLRAFDPSLTAVNLGVSGASTFGYLTLVRDLLESGYRPKQVIVTLFLNDVGIACEPCAFLKDIRRKGPLSADQLRMLSERCERCAHRDEQGARDATLVRRIHRILSSDLATYRFVKDAVVTVLIRAGINTGWGHSAYPALWSRYDGMQFRLVEFSLAEIERLLSTHGIPSIYVIYPEVVGLEAANPWVPILARARERLSERLGTPVFSGYDAFLGDPGSSRNMRFSIVNRHPSCEAHRILGEWLFREWVRKDASQSTR